MIQIQGQYERHEIWARFDRCSGSKHWPSRDPADKPTDVFTCRMCMTPFTLLMYGRVSIGEENFEERALVVLAEHLNIKHPRRFATAGAAR